MGAGSVKRWFDWGSEKSVHVRLALKNGFHLFTEMGVLVFEDCVVSYHGFELNGASQCDGSRRDLFNSQGVCLMCVIVVNRLVDDALDMVGECCGDEDSEFRIRECCLVSRLLCGQEVCNGPHNGTVDVVLGHSFRFRACAVLLESMNVCF